MAYDEDLANRVRELVGGEPQLTEQKMFGGLAFLIGGNMAVAASGHGGLLVRVDPEQAQAMVAGPGVRAMEMRGRPMRGWLLVDPERVHADDRLAEWVDVGMTYARTLPSKRQAH